MVLTKFTPSAPNHKCVDRPRLHSVLDDTLNRRLVLINAPAGYGKTTLVSQWLNTIQHPAAWLTLDEHDSDLGRFLWNLVGSINIVSPKLGHDLKNLLSSPVMPPLTVLTETLLADLAALEKPLVLVLDDFHFIGSESLQIMSHLIDKLPDLLHLIIMTRMTPCFPLASWQVKNWLLTICSDDLSFNVEEARTYCTLLLDRELPDTALEKIVTETEGWVVGIQLMAHSMRSVVTEHDSAALPEACGQNMIDFMMQEVFAKQTAEIKNFLVVTSVLKSFCASLCDYILSGENHDRNSLRIIENLQNQNLFLVSFDTGEGWYRYHNLFHQFLVKQFKNELPRSRKTQIYQRAVQWCTDHEMTEDGLEYFLKAGNLDAAADIIGEQMHALIDSDNSRSLLSYLLALFPDGAEKNQPILILAQAYMKIINWDLDGIAKMLDDAERLLKAPGCEVPEIKIQALSRDIEVIRTFCLYWKGDFEGARHNAHLYLEREKPWRHQYAYALAITYAAGSTAICGHIDEALDLLENAIEEDFREGSLNTAHLLMAGAVIYLYRVNFAGVEKNVHKALAVHRYIPQSAYWMGYVPYLLGSIAYEKNILTEAADHFSQVADGMRYRVNPRMYHDALIGLTVIACIRREEEKSSEYAERALRYAVEANDPLSVYFSELVLVRLAILSGNAAPDPPHQKTITDSNFFWLESPTLIHAEYFISTGTRSDCLMGLKIVEESIAELQGLINVRQIINFLAVKALALWQLGREETALEVLEQSLLMAEPHRLVRSFVNRGPSMAGPVNALLNKQPRNHYLKSIAEIFRSSPSSAVLIPETVENLSTSAPSPESLSTAAFTNREIEILELLSERLTNKEIAQRLHISPITVKSHSVRIYRKLRVHGRRQAVVRATEIGLLRDG